MVFVHKNRERGYQQKKSNRCWFFYFTYNVRNFNLNTTWFLVALQKIRGVGEYTNFIPFEQEHRAERKVRTSRRTARHKQAEYHHTNLPQKKCNSNFFCWVLRLKGSLLTLFSSTDQRKTNWLTVSIYYTNNWMQAIWIS